MENLLVIKNLHAGVNGREIIKGLNLVIRPGEVHALMGPNGSGKSTLANVLAGHPGYEVKRGRVQFCGRNLLVLKPDERAKLGLFLAFQYPLEIPGVSLFNFLKTAYTFVKGNIDFKTFSFGLAAKAKALKIDESFLTRSINEGFSGGEKKKVEILQLAVLQPRLAVLDETDSGLDIDSLKIVAEGVNRLRVSPTPSLGKLRESAAPAKIPDPALRVRSGSGILGVPGILVITHYFRILKYIKPDFVHVFLDGRIVKSGGAELAGKLEVKGYDWLRGDSKINPAETGQNQNDGLN